MSENTNDLLDPRLRARALSEMLYLVVAAYGKQGVLEVPIEPDAIVPDSIILEWHRVGELAVLTATEAPLALEEFDA